MGRGIKKFIYHCRRSQHGRVWEYLSYGTKLATSVLFDYHCLHRWVHKAMNGTIYYQTLITHVQNMVQQ